MDTPQGEHEYMGVIPVLYALAVEIALKALLLRDRQLKEPVRKHNLLELFEELSEEMQSRLERSLPEMRQSLASHQDAFVQWRYSYEEPHGKYFQPWVMEEVFVAIDEVYRQAQGSAA